MLRETVKSIFWIDESVAGSNGPSGRRHECAVQAFSPQVKTLAQGRLCRPEHWNPEEWSRPLGSGCQNKRQLRKQLPFVLAQRVGFEPTCDCSQTDFESSSLRPLRYVSMSNIQFMQDCHMISSHFPLMTFGGN